MLLHFLSEMADLLILITKSYTHSFLATLTLERKHSKDLLLTPPLVFRILAKTLGSLIFCQHVLLT